MADVQRTGRVGRDEFQQDPLALAGSAAAIALGLLEHLGQRGRLRALREIEIDESRAGDLGTREQRARWQCRADRLGDFARRLACLARKAQRDVAGIVTMARIARALDADGARVDGLRQHAADQGLDRIRDQALELGFQSAVLTAALTGNGRRVYWMSSGSTSSAKRTRRACGRPATMGSH